MKKNIFILLLICSFLSFIPAKGTVTVIPSNIQLNPYPVPDDLYLLYGIEEHLIFSFDLLISDSDDFFAQAFQATFSVDLPGLIYDNIYSPDILFTYPGDPCNHDSYFIEIPRWVSENVRNNPDYWLYENSLVSYGSPEGSNEFGFQDFAEDSIVRQLKDGDIVARFSFIWDGTPGDYTFTFNLDPGYSLVLDEYWQSHAIEFNSGGLSSNSSDSFYVYISNPFTSSTPEPTTLILLGLGSIFLLRRHK